MKDAGEPIKGAHAMAVSRFLQDRRANVGIIFALSIVPVFGLAGAAVDYSRASAARTEMQAAADATALMIAKGAATNPNLQSTGDQFFRAQLKQPTALANLAVTSTYSQQGSNYLVNVSATANVKTEMLSVFNGPPTLNLATSAQVTWGNMKLRVALVLDNTGSMLQGSPTNKITALKSAAHQLLSQLQAAAAQPGDVQVAIVPFTTDVNVDPTNVNASWIDWSDWNSNNQNCTTHNNVQTCTPKPHSAWNGCVMDRGTSTAPTNATAPDVMNTTPVPGTPSTQFAAHQASPCPAAMMPLSYDWTALNNRIDAMAAGGNTNQTIGLALGWQALSQGNPFNATALPSFTQQVIILLTDGLNTHNRWTATASKILQDCATDPSMYFALTTPGQIVTTFNTIGTSLAQLRIAR